MLSKESINSEINVKDVREKLVNLNKDRLFGVYTLVSSDGDTIELKMVDDVVSCYENQLENIEGYDEGSGVSIINIKELMKKNISTFKGEHKEIDTPIILSSRVIELFQSSGENKKLHISNVLRDGGSMNKSKRSTMAGKCITEDLEYDLNREYSEESPFIGTDKDGNYILSTPNLNKEGIEYLETSIKSYLENKYRNEGDENYDYVKNNFERNFKGLNYSDLPGILEDIVKNKRYCSYNKTEIVPDGIEEDMRTLKLGDSEGKYYVYFDDANNTIEYASMFKIEEFDEQFIPLSNRPGRLYLESENQYPRIPRIENAVEKHSPAISYFSSKVNEVLDK